MIKYCVTKIIETKRLILRPIVLEDAKDVKGKKVVEIFKVFVSLRFNTTAPDCEFEVPSDAFILSGRRITAFVFD